MLSILRHNPDQVLNMLESLAKSGQLCDLCISWISWCDHIQSFFTFLLCKISLKKNKISWTQYLNWQDLSYNVMLCHKSTLFQNKESKPKTNKPLFILPQTFQKHCNSNNVRKETNCHMNVFNTVLINLLWIVSVKLNICLELTRANTTMTEQNIVLLYSIMVNIYKSTSLP